MATTISSPRSRQSPTRDLRPHAAARQVVREAVGARVQLRVRQRRVRRRRRRRRPACAPPAPRTARGCRRPRDDRRPPSRSTPPARGARSASPSSETSATARSGIRRDRRPAARRSAPSIRSTVAASNRSALYVERAAQLARPPRPGPASGRTWPVSSARRERPRQRQRPGAARPRALFCRANITWKSGAWPRLRSGASSSTSCSNGTSWCCVRAQRRLAHAAQQLAERRARRARSVRSTSVLTKKPISPSVSSRVRPAMGVPTHDVVLPGVRATAAAASAASSVMNSVAPSRRASAAQRVRRSRRKRERHAAAARRLPPAGAGGPSAAPAAAARRPAARASTPAARPARSPRSRARCHAAKSAYCTGSVGQRRRLARARTRAYSAASSRDQHARATSRR